MTDDNKESKLVPKLDLNFTDYAIDTFVPSFEFEDEGGTYTKDKIIIPFNPSIEIPIAKTFEDNNKPRTKIARNFFI